ncbi:MAG: radical SAM protein [Candidatus Omnitrophota bacterium]
MAIKIHAYKDFSWDLHAAAGHKPIVAQMELTYRCPLHCEHCYTDCFNYKNSAKDELSTGQIKEILNKCKADGTIWFYFTGGDPLMRKDFCELYLHARKLGFITSVFSSLVSMNDKILELFRTFPPFNIETTLNAATPFTYKKVTGTDLFNRHVRSIKKLLSDDIPLRVKTQVTKQNFHEIDKIKRLVESFGLDFRPSTMLHAGLDGDMHPCALRLEPKEAVFVNKRYGFFDDEESRPPGETVDIKKLIGKPENGKLLTCAAGGHAFWISPLGKMLICGSLRLIDYDILKNGNSVREGFYELYKKFHGLKFKTKSKCRLCKHKLICQWCAGRAFLETDSLEEHIDYFCRLTEETLA